MDGTLLMGWLLATIGFAGIYGAYKNVTWLSVLYHVVNPSTTAKPINPAAPQKP